MVLLLNIAFPIWGVGTGFPGRSPRRWWGGSSACSRQRAKSIGAARAGERGWTGPDPALQRAEQARGRPGRERGSLGLQAASPLPPHQQTRSTVPAELPETNRVW